MPLPVPDLDDRRFDDLSAELQSRLLRQLPELGHIAPGDPVHAFVDLFAWLAESVIYRANRIPERQRRAFLNLLQIPQRPARPARGIVCIDALGNEAQLPALLPTETALAAGPVAFATVGELLPTPLALHLMIKAPLDAQQLSAEGIDLVQLRHQYGVEPAAFRPTVLTPGRDRLGTAGAADGALYLALGLKKPTLIAQRERVVNQLAGAVINLGLAPQLELDGEVAASLTPRRLDWDLAWWPDPQQPGSVTYLPLEVVSDSSGGGRRTGVVRLRLPQSRDLLQPPPVVDPQYAGVGDTPPEAPAELATGQLLCWLRLRCSSDELELGYLGINAVDVLGVGVARDLMVGLGSGQPDQSLQLPHTDIEDGSLELEVEETQQYVLWQAVQHFAGSGPQDRVYRLDAASGVVQFGDGVRGQRPAAQARIRARLYRYGGGSRGNLPAGSIRQIGAQPGKLALRQAWPTVGGVDRESVEQAERRIPAFLQHRERAVTVDDFSQLALDNPLRPVARANAVAGFLPGANLHTVRRDVPGVISLFVLPELAPACGVAPRPSLGLIRDLHGYLSARTLLGSELYVLSPQFQPIALALSLEVVDPTTEQQTQRAVEQALLHYLWALPPHGPRGQGWPLGRRVEINELRTQAGRVDGVQAVNAVRLFYQDLGDAQWRELTSRQELPLQDYQLPQLMAIAIQAGEDPPAPPRGYAPGSAPSGPHPVPVPVIPTVC